MAGAYDVAFLECERCGEDIVIARFERPSGYGYAAGQWFTLRLDTDDGLVARTFSHSSAPSDTFIELTTRISTSAFKRALDALVPGQIVHIAGPGGHLTLSDHPPEVAFLVGGVGITPVRSILRQAKAENRGFADALLVYGSRDDSCVPFRGELASMGGIGVRLVECYERPPVGWGGESGFITADVVRRHVDPDDGRPFIVTGPPDKVAAMERVLDELRVEPTRRRIERFT